VSPDVPDEALLVPKGPELDIDGASAAGRAGEHGTEREPGEAAR
jgi:hypothetical protein